MTRTIQCIDHLGNVFPSRAAMLRHYNIQDVAFLYRIEKLGWSLEDALTKPKSPDKSTAIPCKDHEGNTFPSKKAMCDYWRIPRATYFRRIRDGWSEKDALTKPIKHNNNHKNKICDHKGQNFTNVDDMCAHWNISKEQYMINIRNNCSIEEALTTVTEWTVCRDHLGNEFPSINAMARHYGTSKTTIRSRIELGWTLEQILTNPHKITYDNECVDHLGNKYPNKKKMLEHYGIHETTFNHRIKKQKMSMAEALQPENFHTLRPTDHLGNTFDSLDDMCDYWNISTSSYHSRYRKFKWSLEDTLTTISKERYTEFGPNLKILKQIDNGFYKIEFENHQYVWSFNQLITYYREHKPEKKITMPRNLKIFDCYINEKEAYILAINETSANKKFRKIAKQSETSQWIGEIPDYTNDILQKYNSYKAGIYFL